MDFTEFLNYKSLDDTQKTMLLDLIKKVKKEEGHDACTKHRPISEDVVADWEKRHNVILPEDYRWFIINVGNYFPEYGIADLKDNEDFSLVPKFEQEYDWETKQDITVVDVYNYVYILGCNGCTFDYVLGLHDYDYGKVYEICADEIADFWNRTSQDSVDEELLKTYIEGQESDKSAAIELGLDEYHYYSYESFLDFYKTKLIAYYEENKTI